VPPKGGMDLFLCKRKDCCRQAVWKNKGATAYQQVGWKGESFGYAEDGQVLKDKTPYADT